MRTSYQSTIATSQFSLPVFGFIAILIWLFLPTNDPESVNTSDYGLWSSISSSVSTGHLSQILGLIITVITTYAMMEFSNTLVLLRISSRMLSCMLTFLLAITLCLHKFQPSHIAILCTLLSYFSLFLSYQNPSPSLIFAAHLLIVTASLTCPKLMFYIPLYWICQIQFRSFTPRTLAASIIAIITPYWFFFVLAMYSDNLSAFTDFFANGFFATKADTSILNISQIVVGIYMLTLFVTGVTGFLVTNAKNDKIRQRAIYNTISIHGLLTVILALLFPGCYNVFLGILILDTSIMAGRFWVVTDNKFTHIFIMILALVAIMVLAITINM